MLFVTGCSWLPKPHRIDIQQGNIISQDDINQLRTGMNKKQVLFVMGSPIITDTFHPNRWDYYYSLERKHIAEPTMHVSLLFFEDLLIRIDGDMQPDPQADTDDQAARNAIITITPKERKIGLTGLIDSMINAVRSDDEKPALQPEAITKPQSPAAAEQEEKNSGGFFDSFIQFFKGDNDNEAETTIAPADSSSEQTQAEPEQTGSGVNLDAFINTYNGDKDGEPEPVTLPAEQAPAEVTPEQQELPDSPDTSTPDASNPDTSDEEQPAEQQPSGTSWNLDSFIKPYSGDKDTGKQQQDSPVEEPDL